MNKLESARLAQHLRALFAWDNYIVHPDPPGQPHMGEVEDTKECHITGVSLTEFRDHREYWERIIAELESVAIKK